MTVQGIDISHHQATTPSLTGLGFVIVKASEGTTPDAKYTYHMTNVLAAGKLAGAYCFARDDVSLDTQARFFAQHSPGATFLAVDVEGVHATTAAQTRLLMERIRSWDTAHRQVGLYMSESGFQEAGQDFDWVANWSQTPHHPYLLWQYQGSPLDRDRYEGTLAQLRAALAPIPPAPPSDIGGPVQTAKLTYYQVANAKAGKPVRDRSGKVIHTTTQTAYPLLATDATEYEIRLPGDVAGFITRSDVGSISEPGPVPPLPPCPECPEPTELQVADGQTYRVVVVAP